MRPLATTPADQRVDRYVRRDRGYVLILVGFLIIPLLGMVGLAVDVGWFYVKAAEVQRSADAAALAGVVYMPNFVDAEVEARKVARENGYTDAQITVEPASAETIRVIINDDDVDTFFATMFLSSPVEIIRWSTAEYVRPIPLGSPLSSFGNTNLDGPGQSPLNIPGDPVQPQFWASIQAPYTDRSWGDPFATKCDEDLDTTARGTGCTSLNPDYRDRGYYYAIEIGPSQLNQVIQFDVFDGGFYWRYNTDQTGDITFLEAGATVYPLEGSTAAAAIPAPTISYNIFQPDATPNDWTDNTAAISGCEKVIAPNSDVGVWKNKWNIVCQFLATQPGVYPIQVKSSAIGASPDLGAGYNQFSLRASAGCWPLCDHPRLYALGEMSILNNASGVSEFFLAEVRENAGRGKEFVVEMFDVGDGSQGDFFLNLIDPQTGLTAASCDAEREDGTINTYSPCRVQTRVENDPLDDTDDVNVFDGEWLKLTVPLDLTYTCSPDCWWRVSYDFSDPTAQPIDRTVWRVTVVGDPVRIIE